MRRFIRFDHLGNVVGEVSANDIMALTRLEVINGEHSLNVTTFQVLNKNERIVYQDGRGIWREYVVAGVDEEHASGKRVIGTYYCVWSVQQDLMGVPVSVMPGVQTPVNASSALSSALSTQSRWAKGTVTNTNTGGASMYDTNAWNALSILVANWSGELSTTIEVANNSGVTARKVDLYSQQGSQTALRRFDFGADLRSIKRIFADEPYYCRISPRGKGEQTNDGYGRKITIESVNGGLDYLEYAPMVDVCKIPDGNGYQYPTLIVENSNCETALALKTWAQGVLADYCTPKITYEIDAVQAGIEGVDVSGVSLGDAVFVVDKYFNDGLRLTGRVTEMTVDELNEREITIKIGYASETLSSKVSSGAEAYEIANNLQNELSTAEYIQNLLDRINAEINATGGYTYITEGQGIRTYDVAVTDPLIGSEASAVVEIKGGAIRIANTKTAQGEWIWKSVFTSGHIAADLVTAANITTGFIGNASNSSYWDLDAGTLTVKDGTITGGTITGSTVISSLLKSSNNLITIDLVGASWAGGILLSSSDYYTRNLYTMISAEGVNVVQATRNSSGAIDTILYPYAEGFHYINQNGTPSGVGMQYSKSSASAGYRGGSISIKDGGHTYIEADQVLHIDAGSIQVTGNFNVTGSKNRIVDTDSYGTRAFYCYETPSPMFGDIGSGKLDVNGVCVVAIDDVFAETVRTDYSYQVFLQKCGDGDIWVEEKKPGYFIVRGTPYLAFDWEIKARQSDFADLRLEDFGLEEHVREECSFGSDLEGMYSEELGFIEEQEKILYEAA